MALPLLQNLPIKSQLLIFRRQPSKFDAMHAEQLPHESALQKQTHIVPDPVNVFNLTQRPVSVSSRIFDRRRSRNSFLQRRLGTGAFLEAERGLVFFLRDGIQLDGDCLTLLPGCLAL
jgi:hypothetical protein